MTIETIVDRVTAILTISVMIADQATTIAVVDQVRGISMGPAVIVNQAMELLRFWLWGDWGDSGDWGDGGDSGDSG